MKPAIGRARRRAAAWAGVLLCAACTDASTKPVGVALDGRDASDAAFGSDDAGPLPFSAIANRPLDELGARETDALCVEKRRHTDPCLELAMAQTSKPDECDAMVTACRASLDAGLQPACGAEHFGPPGRCPVSARDYAACLDAWTAALTCEDAAYRINAPALCADILEKCPRLKDELTIGGRPRPCTEAERVDRPDTSDDIFGLDACRPAPERFVVLGDSIAECTGVTHEECAPYLVADHLREHVAPGLEFETYAWPGSRIRDLIGQAQKVSPGAGHVMVFMYAVGNDMIAVDFDEAEFLAGYAEVFDYFSDASRFPGGATFLLNTQYNPYDECYVDGAQNSLPATFLPLVLSVNQHVFLDVAVERADTVAVDQYPDFLGHGVNGDITGCPYCSHDNTPWSDDGLHPNAAGHLAIAKHWFTAIDRMFGSCNGG